MNKLYKALVYDKQVSLSVLDTTDLVNKAISIHGLDAPSAVLLGGLLTSCAYMAGCLKSDRGAVSITVKSADGDGSASVSGDIGLHIRGYVNGSCRRTFKGGTLTVIKDDGFFRPFIGACRIESDDVSQIMTDYFTTSEQIRTIVRVGVEPGEDGACASAGGVIMQLLPGTSPENAARAEEAMRGLSDPAQLIAASGAEGVVKSLSGGEIAPRGLWLLHPDYICNCSREKIKNVIIPLGREELDSICDEQGAVSVHCHYCNTDYTFDKDDIRQIFENEKGTQN